jgi:hypothetical protein
MAFEKDAQRRATRIHFRPVSALFWEIFFRILTVAWCHLGFLPNIVDPAIFAEPVAGGWLMAGRRA